MTRMLQDFPAWYATLEVAQGATATARWAGVAKALEKPQVDEVEAFIRLALKSRQLPNDAVKARIIGNIAAGDPTFGTVAADRELQVLAAAALVARLILSDTAALALTTAGLDGARKPALPMDLLAMAENAVREKSKSSRSRIKVATLRAEPIEWELPEEEETPDALVSLQALKDAAETALTDTISKASEVIVQLARRQELVDEELQMLWFLTSGELSDGGSQAELKIDKRPLAVADELARRTAARPGPMAIPALLSRASLNRKTKIKVADAVNAMDDAWCKAMIGNLSISPVTHPIHEALRRRDETGRGADWIKGWAAASEIPENHSISSLRLAELFYRERLLLTVAA